MKRIIIAIIVLAGLASGLFIYLKTTGDRVPPGIERVCFTPQGADIEFNSELEIKQVRVTTPDGTDQLDLHFSGVRRRSLSLYWSWQPGMEYKFMVRTNNKDLTKKKKADPDRPAAGVILAVPYTGLEQENHDRAGRETSIGVMAGAEVTGALLITNYIEGGADYRGEIVFPAGVRATIMNKTDGATLSEQNGIQVLSFKTRLASSSAKYHLIFKIKPLDRSDYRLAARVEYQAEDVRGAYRRTAGIGQESIEQLAGGLGIKRIIMPSGPTGLQDWKKQSDTVFYKPPLFNRISRMLGFNPVKASPWFPYTYQTVELENRTDSLMTLLIHSKIFYQDRDAAPRAFWPSQIFTGAMKDNSVVVGASVEPGQTARAVVPIFVTDQPDPGVYRRVLSIVPTGFDQPLKNITLPLYVSTMNYNALGFTLASIVLAAGAVAFFSLYSKYVFTAWKVRWVVIIALFGAVSFTVVNLPIRVFGSVVNAVLGPFSVFIIGFFNDLLYYTLLTALLRLIPRPGVMTLMVLVRFFLSGFMTGFHILEALLTGSSILLTETGLYLSGLTRKKEDFEWTWKSATVLALVLGTVGVYMNAAGIYLHMLLFRLYYADWYIFLSILMNGFVFTFVGVMLGKKFSDRLIWVEE